MTTTTVERGSDFAALMHVVRDAGLLDRRPVAYGVRAALTIGLYAGTFAAVLVVGDSWFQLVLAVVLAFAFGQIAFLGHDAGHQAVFSTRRRNDAMGRVLANGLSGLSFGWWVQTHDRHHANPNREDSDPDIGDGVLAFTPTQAADRGGPVSRFIARRQAWLFFPLTLLEGISLHVDSVIAVAHDRDRSARGGTRRTEAIGLVLHAAGYLTLLLLAMSPAKALAFVGVHQAAWGLYMSLTFAPAHKGMPLIGPDEKLDFLSRQVMTSRDVRGGWLVDLALGGLNHQVAHHLFPNMPRPALRRAQPIIREYCEARGLHYCEAGLLESYRMVLKHLNAIGAPLRAERAGAPGSRS